jgi:hypothetical protein
MKKVIPCLWLKVEEGFYLVGPIEIMKKKKKNDEEVTRNSAFLIFSSLFLFPRPPPTIEFGFPCH